MNNVINIDKFRENKINTYYEEYIERLKDRKLFYDLIIKEINKSIQENKTFISVYIDKRLYFDKIFELLEEEFKEMGIILHKEREFYKIYISEIKELEKIRDFYLKVKEEKIMTKEEFIEEKKFLFE